jgi:hypothetical protein
MGLIPSTALLIMSEGKVRESYKEDDAPETKGE